jgi:hypothetical protein
MQTGILDILTGRQDKPPAAGCRRCTCRFNRLLPQLLPAAAAAVNQLAVMQHLL